MAASLTKTLFAVVAIFIIIATTAATDYKVGSPGGWDLQTDLSTWASKISFKIDDNLVFVYDKSKHDVVEVTKTNFDSCSTAGPLKTLNSGNDIVPLSSAGSRYFICGVPTHCANGMKVQIDTAAASANSPAPENGTPGGPTSPSAAGRRALDGKAAVAGLIGAGAMMMLAL